MIEYYCNANESPQKEKHNKQVEMIAQYLLDEVCSDYEYEWSNALEGDKEAFREYAREILETLTNIS